MKIFLLTIGLSLSSHLKASEQNYFWEDDGNHYLKCFQKYWNNHAYVRMNGGRPVDESRCTDKKQLVASKSLLYQWEDDGKHYLKCFQKFWNGVTYVRMNGGSPIEESYCTDKKKLIASKNLVYQWEDDGNHYLKCYEKFWNGITYVRMNGGNPVECEMIPPTNKLKKSGTAPVAEKSVEVDESNRNSLKEKVITPDGYPLVKSKVKLK